MARVDCQDSFGALHQTDLQSHVVHLVLPTLRVPYLNTQVDVEPQLILGINPDADTKFINVIHFCTSSKVVGGGQRIKFILWRPIEKRLTHTAVCGF